MPSIPKPFSRPKIDLGGVSRTWKYIAPAQVVEDDIVAGHGRVNCAPVPLDNTVLISFRPADAPLSEFQWVEVDKFTELFVFSE